MASGNVSYEEHQFRRIISGELETVRKRMCDVLEDFGYAVLGDNPIQCKRRRQRSLLTATILECHTQLTVALKPISTASTLGTFDYVVEYMFTRGDRRTLEREADAIIALATAPVNRTICPSCKTENDGSVRFCRVCGMPARHDLPLEIEFMRMSADASSAHLEISIGLILQVLTLVVSLPMILLGVPQIVRFGWILFAIGEVLSAFPLLQGVYRLKTAVTLKVREENRQIALPGAYTDTRESLAAQPISVTEGTTELMRRAEMPSEQAKDTDSIQ